MGAGKKNGNGDVVKRSALESRWFARSKPLVQERKVFCPIYTRHDNVHLVAFPKLSALDNLGLTSISSTV